MMNGRRKLLTLGTIAFSLAACDVVGPEDTLGQFEWGELETGPVEEYAIAERFGSEVVVLGELNAPTACYRLEADASKSGSRATLTIDVATTTSPNCAERIGSYRYSALLRGLDGIDELRVVHNVAGGETTEYIIPLTEES
jgi:hypothetical protein